MSETDNSADLAVDSRAETDSSVPPSVALPPPADVESCPADGDNLPSPPPARGLPPPVPPPAVLPAAQPPDLDPAEALPEFNTGDETRPAWRLILRGTSAVTLSVIVHLVVLIALACLYIVSEDPPEKDALLASYTTDDSDPLEYLEEFVITPDDLKADLAAAAAESVAEANPFLFDGGAAPLAELDDPTDRFGLAEVQMPDLGKALNGDGRGLGDGVGAGLGKGLYSDAFEQIVSDAGRHGLDVVIVFDSTGSMGGEIEAVKQRIRQIGGALLRKLPQTRIGICTYRDVHDEYLVKGLPLSNNLVAIDESLRVIHSGGGGDRPEAVLAGLRWALTNNQFRPKARKVLLLFGDAPPHAENVQGCLMLAGQFHDSHGGIVSTISCRTPLPLPEFVEIARVGGGEAFMLADHRRIMEELLVLAFGGKHRRDVIKFFGLRPAGPQMPGRAPGVGRPPGFHRGMPAPGFDPWRDLLREAPAPRRMTPPDGFDPWTDPPRENP